MKYWRTRNDCAPQAIQETLPKSPHVRIDRYQNCKNESSVKLYTVEGGEHGWGDAEIKLTNKAHETMNTSAVIWDFFNQQTMR